jgi:regulator of cell morphogenesis and NO signaling
MNAHFSLEQTASNELIAANINKHLDFKSVVLQALEVDQKLSDQFIHSLSLTDLIQHLKWSHRYYLNTKLPEIEQSIYACYSQQEEADQLLLLLCSFFIEYKKKLIEHIRIEERFLFPYIEQVLLHPSGPEKADLTVPVGYSLTQFEATHTDLEKDLANVCIRIQAKLPEGDLPLPFRIFITQLELFERDLAVHAYLEDDILLPKAKEMEATLKQRSA